MKELEILLNKRWVLKSRDKETYYKLRDALGELRKFTTEKMGCQIIDNSLLIKMEKIPVIPESFMGIQKFSSKEEYAYLCIRNASLKFIEKREKIDSSDILLNEEEYLYICESLEENEREQKEKELEKALAALPEQEKKALYGVVIENKSYKAVASELHISVNTLKTYLARAMKKLRKNEKLLLVSLFLINLS